MGPTTNGMAPQMVSGVSVKYNSATNSMQFTTGTTGQTSYIKVSGDAQWGLSGLTTAYGSTSTWIKPTAATNSSGATEYITSTGDQTTSATGFTNVPEWSPVYLKEGELTFNTSGALVSPAQGTKLSTVYLPNGKGALTLNINYSKSAQSASAFAVNSQSQDGAPEGGLVGVNVDTNGLVQATYSNGSTQSLGKVVLVNFSNPAGLKQLGNTEWYSSSASGTPRYAEAGSAGYGTVQSGSLETSNVDLTTELVNLISEQQAFQSNSKALQTDTQLTQSIIQINA
jgi:flagellar hook-basal body protein